MEQLELMDASLSRAEEAQSSPPGSEAAMLAGVMTGNPTQLQTQGQPRASLWGSSAKCQADTT